MIPPKRPARAFGKLNPYQYGILPVLVVIQNDSDQAIRVDRRARGLCVAGRQPRGCHPGVGRALSERSAPAQGRHRARFPPRDPRISRKKNPLDAWEIEGRAFSAKMIPPGQSGGGFFYFQTGHRPGARLYVTGIAEASSGRELLYFEFPLEGLAAPGRS